MSNPPTPPKVWSSGGPGRKQCPGCKSYIGNRSKKCGVCGYAFETITHVRTYAERQGEKEAKVIEEHVQTVARADTDKRPFLCIPAGVCPVPLEGTSLADVQIWMQDLKDTIKDFRLLPECFRYYARSYFKIGSPEYNIVVGHIQRHAVDA